MEGIVCPCGHDPVAKRTAGVIDDSIHKGEVVAIDDLIRQPAIVPDSGPRLEGDVPEVLEMEPVPGTGDPVIVGERDQGVGDRVYQVHAAASRMVLSTIGCGVILEPDGPAALDEEPVVTRPGDRGVEDGDIPALGGDLLDADPMIGHVDRGDVVDDDVTERVRSHVLEPDRVQGGTADCRLGDEGVCDREVPDGPGILLDPVGPGLGNSDPVDGDVGGGPIHPDCRFG